jgi:hypothetical protein
VEQGRENGSVGGGTTLLNWPNRRKNGGRNADLRRAIVTAWGDLSEGKRGGNGEGFGGFVGRASTERERSRNGRGVTGGINGGNARVDGERREMTWGSHTSEKKRREGKVTVREGLLGRDVSVLGCLGTLLFLPFLFLLSLYSFLFLFSYFLFLLYLLQKCFKSNQTSFRNFQKDCT